jgi:hypothetical protein
MHSNAIWRERHLQNILVRCLFHLLTLSERLLSMKNWQLWSWTIALHMSQERGLIYCPQIGSLC